MLKTNSDECGICFGNMLNKDWILSYVDR